MSEHCIEQTNTDNLSPLKQIRAGLGIGQIECKANFELLIGENGIFFCVTPQTKEILIKRGW